MNAVCKNEKRTYICGGTQTNSREKHVNAPLLRREFLIENLNAVKERGAEIEISAVGLYRLFLNGKDITKGYFAPYINNADDVIYFDKYDVTSLLQEKNVIAVLLGNGFAAPLDCGVWNFETAPQRVAPSVYLELLSGENKILGSDDGFSVCPSCITFDDIRLGEHYDARLEKSGVFDYGFSEDGDFYPAIVAENKGGEYLECKSQPVRSREEGVAVRIIKCKAGFVYDFGTNKTGLCRLKINATEGTRVVLHYFEIMRGGEPCFKNLDLYGKIPAECIQRDEYVCKEGYQEYLPSFTYHGFRYVLVAGISQSQAVPDLLECVSMSNDMPAVGKFECGDAVVNEIQKCAKKSDENCFVCFPVDCPQREKNGWTADASLSVEQFLYNYDCSASLEEWHRNILKAQRADGAFPGIVPTFGWGFDWGNGPAWDSVFLEIPYMLYKMEGNIEIAKRTVAAAEKYFAYIEKRLNSDGLVAIGLGDWCESGRLSNTITTPLEITDSLTIVELAEKASEILRAAGASVSADKIARLGNLVKQAFIKKYVVDGCSLSCKTQTAFAMALKRGIFVGENEKKAYNELKDMIKAADYHALVGVIGIKPLFDVIAERGDCDFVLKMILNPTYPSYAQMVSFGLGTLWEAFQYFNGEDFNCLNEEGVNWEVSYDHHFWGSVSAWFYRFVGGVRYLDANTVLIKPEFLPELKFAEAETGKNGKFVSVRWEILSDGSVAMKIKNRGYKIKTDFGRRTVVDVKNCKNGESDEYEIVLK